MQSNVRVSVDDNARNTNADDKSVSFTKWEEDDVCPSHGNNSDTVATPLDSGIRRRRHAQQKPGASTTKESQLLNARTDDDEEDDGGSVSQGTGRRRRGTPVMAMPSKEVREAVRCFNESIEHAMRLASENSTLNTRTISS